MRTALASPRLPLDTPRPACSRAGLPCLASPLAWVLRCASASGLALLRAGASDALEAEGARALTLCTSAS